MEKEELGRFLCREGESLVRAMMKIDHNAQGIVYVVDEAGRLLGSLSDGDIRRWILRTGSVETRALEAANRKVNYLFQEDASREKDFMAEKEIRSVPIVDADLTVREIKFIYGVPGEADSGKITPVRTLCDTPIVIMAGGKGSRLYPYTKILPKPLIPIGDVPILERIMNRFSDYGACRFYLTVNYKKEMIKSYFAEGNHPYSICFIEEKEPLGTAGSIRLIQERFATPVLVTNCDILIQADYGELLRFHQTSRNDMTIVSSMKNIPIPYGVLEVKERGIVKSMEEKPQLSYMVNTGMYLINPEFLEWIPEERFFHMTDLAERMIQEGRQVGMYPVSENSFLDMGEFEEMKKMEERIMRTKGS